MCGEDFVSPWRVDGETGGDLHQFQNSIVASSHWETVTANERPPPTQLARIARYAYKAQGREFRYETMALNSPKDGGPEEHRSAKDQFEDIPDWYDEPELSEVEANPDFVPPKRELADGWGIAPNVSRVSEKPSDSYRLADKSIRLFGNNARDLTDKRTGGGGIYTLIFLLLRIRQLYLLYVLVGVFLGLAFFVVQTDRIDAVEQGECITDTRELSAFSGERIRNRPFVYPNRVLVVPCDRPNFGEVVAIADVTSTEERGEDAQYWDSVRAACVEAAGPQLTAAADELVLVVNVAFRRAAGNNRTLCVLPQAQPEASWAERFPGNPCVEIQGGASGESTWSVIASCGASNGSFPANSAYQSASIEAEDIQRPSPDTDDWDHLVDECKAEIISRIHGFDGDLDAMTYEILVPPSDLWDQGERLVYCALPTGQGFVVG